MRRFGRAWSFPQSPFVPASPSGFPVHSNQSPARRQNETRFNLLQPKAPRTSDRMLAACAEASRIQEPASHPICHLGRSTATSGIFTLRQEGPQAAWATRDQPKSKEKIVREGRRPTLKSPRASPRRPSLIPVPRPRTLVRFGGRALSRWHGAKRCFWMSTLCNVEFNSKSTFSKSTKELLMMLTKTADPRRLTCEDRILHDTEVWIPTYPPPQQAPLLNTGSRDAQRLTGPGPHASRARLSSSGILRRRFEEGCPASLAPTSGLELSYYAPRAIRRALREVLIRESLLTYASQHLKHLSRDSLERAM